MFTLEVTQYIRDVITNIGNSQIMVLMIVHSIIVWLGFYLTKGLVRHYTCLSKKSRHSGFSPLKKRPEFEFTDRDSLCLCLIIHS